MQVKSELLCSNSEKDFADELKVLSFAGAGVIHVRTNEAMRCAELLRELVLVDGNELKEWNVTQGFIQYSLDNMMIPTLTGDGVNNILRAIMEPMQSIQEVVEGDDVYKYYVYVHPHYWFNNNPPLMHMLLYYARTLSQTKVRVVLITPDIPLPDILENSITAIHFKAPSYEELYESLSSILEDIDYDLWDIDEEGKKQICFAGAGMTKLNFETFVSIAIVEASSEDEVVTTDHVLAGVAKGKTEAVKASDILELFPTEDMNNVGGLELLKEWVNERKECFTDKAEEFGITPPKGVVCVGVPGSGKSLFSKAVAKEFGVPLIRLDFGRVFNSLVGESESRMRSALAMVESMAPCTLLADEIDKGLGGMGGSGDSGTSSRVFGSFLTWLQENTAPVFTIVTANNISNLPPELTRRGRFDEIFGTGFPSRSARKEVLSIHLRKRGYDIADFSEEDIVNFCNASMGFVPAEIEHAVNTGLIRAYNDKEADGLLMEHIVGVLKDTVPLAKAYSAEIQAMVVWMKAHTVPASLDDVSMEEISSGKEKGNVLSLTKTRKVHARRRPKKHEED